MLTASSKLPTQISHPLNGRQNDSELGMPVLLKTTSPDPEARSFLRIFNFVAWRPPSVYSLAQLRQRWRHFALVMGRRDPAAKVCDLTINGSSQISLRIYFPDSGRELHPVLLWIRGGAFLIGELDTADSVCRNIANAGGCPVVAVEYRLAPEHDLHAGREDCKSALDWIFDHGAQFGLDPQRVAVGGDPAGGNIAAVLAQQSVNRQHPPLGLQVLAYPATNLADEFASKNDNAKGYLLTAEANN